MRKISLKLLLISALALVVSAGIAGILTSKETGFVDVKHTAFLDKMQDLYAKFTSSSTERSYLQTDKPLYGPGETIWFQAYIVNTKDIKPSENSDIIHVQLINPKGGIEQEMKMIASNGSAGGDFSLNENIAGGLYKLKAFTTYQGNQKDILAFEKEIQVQQVILPRLKMKLDFAKKAYGPGDEVAAKVEFTSLDNKPLARQEVTYILNLDGQKYVSGKDKTDSKGMVNVKVKLPADLKTNDGLLGVLIENEGRTESITRSVPIILNKISLSFFPEGGDMVANLQSKVAFRAMNEFEKPADIEGIVEDDLGHQITTFTSYHFGMGSFNMTPVPGRQYNVKITRPEGIKEKYTLPAALIAGFTISVPSGANGKDLQVVVNSTLKEELSVFATVRDKIYYQGAFDAVPGENVLKLPVNKFPMGVAQITLFDSKGVPRAERLVFANRKKQLKISVSTNKEKYQPREKVDMQIKTTDENGNPVPANLSLAVVDDKLLSFADDRTGTILSRLYLEPELKEKVEEAAFYFDPNEPKADSAMDYLMLTSGWRRFTWKQVINGEYPSAAYGPEKSVIGGRVYDVENNKPLKHKKMTLKGSDQDLTTYSDTSGRFSFKLKQLNGTVTIAFADTGYVGNTQLASSFMDNINMAVESNAFHKKQVVILQKRVYESVTYDMAVNHVQLAPMPAMAGGLNVYTFATKKELHMRGNRAAAAAMDMPGPDLKPEPKIEKDEAIVEVKAKQLKERFDEKQFKAPDNNVYYYRTREFPAPVYKERHNDDPRTDFRSTIFWKGGIETDADGNATVSFYNSDDVTAFRATAEGIGGGMAGHSDMVFYTQLPFSISAKIPDGAAAGDEIKLPVALTNNTAESIEGTLDIASPKSWQPMFSSIGKPKINPHETKVVTLDYRVLNNPGKDSISITFKSSGQSDNISREIYTSERGFPEMISFSGQDKDKTYAIEIGNPLEGSVHADMTAYPSSLSETMKGLDAILREPYGCFEQTSSSNYPNIIALMYMKETGDKNEAVHKRAMDLLDQGYKRLVTFETPKKGYEWFGSSPAHEALTAYGLMEFNDMKGVYASVDKGMIDRTANWLMSRKDGTGFMRDSKALDNFGRASEEVTNAYIVYALTEGGYQDIKPQLDASVGHAQQSGDAYELGLVANALFNMNDTRAAKMMDKLTSAQSTNGSWMGKQSITCSGGTALCIETTSLIAMAYMKLNVTDQRALQKAIKYIIDSRDGNGGWGNTQTTVLALKCLTRYAQYSKHTQEPGAIVLMVDGKTIATQKYAAGQKDEIKLAGLEKYLTPGKHTIRVKYEGTKNPLPYTVSIRLQNINPANDNDCKLKLSTSLAAKEVNTGGTVRLTATLQNKTAEGQPMSIAILGIPAGLSAQPWQLKELQDKKVYDFYEIKGNNVVVYYRQMTPNEARTINLDLKAEIPGTYQAPASSAYLYYTAENKSWCKAEDITVKDK